MPIADIGLVEVYKQPRGWLAPDVTSPNADDRQIQIHMRDGRPAGIICGLLWRRSHQTLNE